MPFLLMDQTCGTKSDKIYLIPWEKFNQLICWDSTAEYKSLERSLLWQQSNNLNGPNLPASQLLLRMGMQIYSKLFKIQLSSTLKYFYTDGWCGDELAENVTSDALKYFAG